MGTLSADAMSRSHISETLRVIGVLLNAHTLTPTGVYMGALHSFLLSWSEDLKLRGEHRGPRLERTLQKCEFYVELPYFYNFLKMHDKIHKEHHQHRAQVNCGKHTK